MRLVLKMLSESAMRLPTPALPTIAPETTAVLTNATARQMRALAMDRERDSPLPVRPILTLLKRRSPKNIVADLERKSDATIIKAVFMLPMKYMDEQKVMKPAVTRHPKALTRLRDVVSRNDGASAFSTSRSSRLPAT